MLRVTRRAPPSPRLLIVCGKVASGKSTVARLLSARTGFAVFSSDHTRKALVGLQPTRGTNSYQRGAYSEEVTQRTYARLWADAKQTLTRGKGVIIDVTFADAQHRRLFIELASQHQVPLLFIECRSDEGIIRERLQERQSDPHEVWDANWTIYQKLRVQFAPFSDLPDACHFPVDTDDRLLARLERLENRL